MGVHAYEFTQLDFEVRDGNSEWVRWFVEWVLCGLVCSLRKHMKGELVYLGRYDDLRRMERLFRVYNSKELEGRHGVEWKTQLVLEAYGPVRVTDVPIVSYDFEDFENDTWRARYI